jgi:hypothetical protein
MMWIQQQPFNVDYILTLIERTEDIVEEREGREPRVERWEQGRGRPRGRWLDGEVESKGDGGWEGADWTERSRRERRRVQERI